MRTARDLAEMAAILAAVGLLGFPLVRRLPELSRAEIAAWSWIAGLLALTGAELVLVLSGLRPDPWKLWGLLAAAALAFRGRGPAVPRARSAPTRIGRFAWLFALGGLALFSVAALSEPMWAWDYVAIWGLKGKTLFLSGALPSRFFHDPGFAFVHPSYPLLLPALFAALATLAGGWDSQALALLYPAFELATLLATWGFLRRRCNAAGAAAGTVLTAAFFPLYQSFLVGLADIPMALGFVLAGSAFLDALRADAAPRLRPLILSALFCCGLKKEGAVFLLLLAAAAATIRVGPRRNAMTAAAVFAAVPILHQAAMRWLRGPAVDSSFQLSLIAQRGGTMFLHRLRESGARIVLSATLPVAVTLAAVVLILVFSRGAIADRLLLPLGAMTCLYAVAPAASTWSDAAGFADSTFWRVTNVLFPLLFFALGARISTSFERFSLPFPAKEPTMK